MVLIRRPNIQPNNIVRKRHWEILLKAYSITHPLHRLHLSTSQLEDSQLHPSLLHCPCSAFGSCSENSFLDIDHVTFCPPTASDPQYIWVMPLAEYRLSMGTVAPSERPTYHPGCRQPPSCFGTPHRLVEGPFAFQLHTMKGLTKALKAVPHPDFALTSSRSAAIVDVAT